MKQIFFVVLFVFESVFVFSQADSFSSPKDMLGKQIYVLPGDLLPCTYVMKEGKLKLAQKEKKTKYVINQKSYTVSNEMYVFKKENYLVLNGTSEMFFLKESDGPLFLSFIKNESYWKDYIANLNKSYLYLDIEKGKELHKYDETICYDKLSRIKWKTYSFQENGVNLIANEVTEQGIVMRNDIVVSLDQFNSLKDFVFIHKDKIGSYVEKYESRLALEKRNNEIQDSLYNRKLRLAIAKKDMVFGEEGKETYVDEGDTIAIYCYKDTIDKFVGRFRYANILLKDEDIKFVDYEYSSATYNYTPHSVDKEYLKSIGDKGVSERFAVAFEYDTLKTEVYVSKLKNDIKAYKDKISNLKSKQIFITEASYNYDDEQFGMDYTIFNCFSKTIKYVAITLTCYNNVGDVQRDYFGRAAKTIRGIGPIEPGRSGSYSWEKIFWDEYDVIKKCVITSIVFTFTDGTKKSFSGKTNIEKHFADDAWN